MQKELQKIYLVKPENQHDIQEIAAIFDTEEKAEAFINRFKQPSESVIYEMVINPEYLSDKNNNPYFVCLEKEGRQPRDIFVTDLIDQDLMALNQEYWMEFFGDCLSAAGSFNVTLFAADEAEAIQKALAIRKSVIDSGEWEQCWLKHLQKLK